MRAEAEAVLRGVLATGVASARDGRRADAANRHAARACVPRVEQARGGGGVVPVRGGGAAARPGAGAPRHLARPRRVARPAGRACRGGAASLVRAGGAAAHPRAGAPAHAEHPTQLGQHPGRLWKARRGRSSAPVETLAVRRRVVARCWPRRPACNPANGLFGQSQHAEAEELLRETSHQRTGPRGRPVRLRRAGTCSEHGCPHRTLGASGLPCTKTAKVLIYAMALRSACSEPRHQV